MKDVREINHILEATKEHGQVYYFFAFAQQKHLSAPFTCHQRRGWVKELLFIRRKEVREINHMLEATIEHEVTKGGIAKEMVTFVLRIGRSSFAVIPFVHQQCMQS
ncbi:hypothetical protein AVEN_118667-1 [Araneus ventricosus]|uniref:Uncharacterized protein n=1 Tax=Araneus ventricosus TaxID=182803 RepID=A0A4Y2AX25_ARAVE|nr:hypothetical protein AVEN_118667-1 [Araneus ventricosus]